MSKETLLQLYNRGRPYLAMVFIQCSYAVSGLVVKSALNKGMNHYTFAIYRNVSAAVFFAPFALFFERKVRPRMTISIFFKIMLLALLEPVIDMNLFYTGMKYTTATFATAMTNMLPAIAFFMAWIVRSLHCLGKILETLVTVTGTMIMTPSLVVKSALNKLEKVNLRSLHSQGKILGTLVTVGGAMIMTLIQGPAITLPWTKATSMEHPYRSRVSSEDCIKGSIMITTGCFCWASFVILQAITLKSYPAELSLTTLICTMGAVQGSILTLVVEKGNTSIWSIQWDIKLIAAIYCGIICSGTVYYLSGMVMRERGPVFVTAFNPLSMVIVAIMGSFFLAEQMDLGRVLGAMVIVVGLYLVIWGKSKDQSSSKSGKDEITSMDQEKKVMNDGTRTTKHDLNFVSKNSDIEAV